MSTEEAWPKEYTFGNLGLGSMDYGILDKWGVVVAQFDNLDDAKLFARVKSSGLTEEWSVWTDDGQDFIDPDGFITDDRAEAEMEAAEKCQSCDHCRNPLPKHVISRLVSPWVVD